VIRESVLQHIDVKMFFSLAKNAGGDFWQPVKDDSAPSAAITHKVIHRMANKPVFLFARAGWVKISKLIRGSGPKSLPANSTPRALAAPAA
jgi:hypothetical protein